MGNKFLIFRADGNTNTGLGHLYRTFALIEMFKAHFEYQLLVKESSLLTVIPKNYNLRVLSDDVQFGEEPQWLASHYSPENTVIIADGYQFNSGFQRRIKDAGFKLVYIDDLAKEHMYADIVINHSPHVEERDFKTQHYTQFALGTAYAVLRPLFLEAAKKEKQIKPLATALVCFGGVDFNDLTFKTVQAILQSKVFKNISVVVGAGYDHKAVYALAQERQGIEIYKNISEGALFKVMDDCDFAVVPSSTVLYEVCALKMPVMAGYFVDNQIAVYKAFLDKGMIYGVGDFNTVPIGEMSALISMISHDDHKKCRAAQQRMFDSKIKQRFLGLIGHTQYPDLGEKTNDEQSFMTDKINNYYES